MTATARYCRRAFCHEVNDRVAFFHEVNDELTRRARDLLKTWPECECSLPRYP
jgi:hypothetical protein